MSKIRAHKGGRKKKYTFYANSTETGNIDAALRKYWDRNGGGSLSDLIHTTVKNYLRFRSDLVKKRKAKIKAIENEVLPDIGKAGDVDNV